MEYQIRWSVLTLLAFCLPWSLLAQGTAGTITGFVTDATGGAVTQATVKITNQATGIARETQTNDSGFYIFVDVLPAVYEVAISAPGFKQFVAKDVTLQVKAGLRVDARLELGAVTETVNVVGTQAPLLESVSAKVGAIVETKQITELPLNGRQFAQLILLTPGALPIALGQSTSFKVQLGAGSYSPVINGQRSRYHNYVLDGIENNDPMFNSYAINPSVDAIQEFSVQTRGGVAEQGRSMGSDVVVVTRSGGNQFHGSLYEFFRNQRLDARNFFDPSNPAYRQNQFGGTFGGPMRLPHYDGRNRTFFFGYYEGFRSVRSSNSVNTVPTQAMRGGDFSESGVPRIYDIATTRADSTVTGGYARDPFPGNLLPASRLNSTAVDLLKTEYPLPNRPGLTYNYQNTMGQQIVNDQGSLRVDHKFTDNNNLFGRISYNNGYQHTPGAIPKVYTSIINVDWNATVSDTHIIRPNLIGHVQFGLNRYTSSRFANPVQERFLKAAGWDQIYPSGPPYYLTLSVSITDTVGLAGKNTPIGPHTIYQSIGDLTWIKGRHTIKTGITWYTMRSFQASPQASIAFARTPTTDLSQQSKTGYGVATFLLGLPTGAKRTYGDTSARLSNNEYAGYIQDEMHLTPKFTLSAGLRYSYVQPPKEARNAYSGLDVITGEYLMAVKNPITGAGPNLRERWVDPQWNNIAPRMGLVYLLGEKTTLRAGAGIYYSYTDYVQFFGDPAGQWPFGYTESVSNLNKYYASIPFSNPFINSKGVTLANSPEGQSGYSLNPRMKIPYATQWTFSMQRALSPNVLVEATYLGATSVKNLQTRPDNNALPGPGDVDPRRRWPKYGPIDWDDNGAPASYHGLSLRFTKRFSHGLSVLSSYTWAHNIDVWSTEREGTSGGPQDPLNWRADRASSTADVRHSFLLSNTYELPFGRRKRFLNSGPLSYVLGNWQWSNIIGFYSGQPVNVGLGYDNANTGSAGDQRPDLVGDPTANRTRLQWINLAAFAAPPLYTYGNAGRNIVLGPGLKNWDIGLMKNFPFRESGNLQFRSEFFNAFNIVNFGAPQTKASYIAAAGFGTITSARPARIIQFSLKLSF